MIRIVFILTLLCNALVAAQAVAGWKAVPASGEQTLDLMIMQRGDQDYISLKTFCRTFKCKVVYQWASHRVLIQNAKSGAIVSALTQSAIVDGNLVEFQSKVISDPKIGYLLPVELAEKLAAGLYLGRVYNDKPPEPAPAPKSEVKPVADLKSLREIKTLVIDPGHGGNDIGTKHGDLLEKDIALFYALKLRDDIKREFPEMNVFLTREADTYVSLPDRAKFANDKGAEFFLSLHVNHAPSGGIHGAETYILNPNATDDDAKKTALLENESWIKSLKGKDPASNNVMKILADMEQTKYIQNSAHAAAFIQQELSTMNATLGLKNRGVKQAMFFVLSQVAMPSVLVEMGFLSSVGDRGRLMDLKFRNEFVSKIVTALKRYRKE